MNKASRGWTVDQLAAQQLCADLNMTASDELIDRIAGHFSEHRKNMLQWAAQRIHDQMFKALEQSFANNARDHDEGWMRGFQRAEELLLTMAPQDMLALEPERTRSKGQILRAMIRQARQS